MILYHSKSEFRFSCNRQAPPPVSGALSFLGISAVAITAMAATTANA
jgi:hypothetical protein